MNRGSNCIGSLLEHHLITAFNLPIQIHDPVHYGPGIKLGIVPVYTEFTPAILGVPVEGPHRVVQMVGLHLFDRD